MCNLKDLEVLDLSNNFLTGTIPKCLVAMNGTLGALNLRRNKLSGSIDTFPGPSYLRILQLNGNLLQGKLPKYLATCNMLEVLDIGNNQIDDEFPCCIPQFLCNASSLLVLDLSDNNFDGTIPECLTKSETLAVLNLRNNRLNGTIPDTFPASCALQTRDIHQNSLGGMIPKSLANCRMLEVLDLGKNKIMDGFPCLLKNISTCRVLVLRENKFHGHILCPVNPGTWHNLQSIDLAFNSFRGTIPEKSFASWEAMMHDEDQAVLETKHISESSEISHSNENPGSLIDWNFISAELGFVLGPGTVFALQYFRKPWRLRYWNLVDDILCQIFPQLYLSMEYDRGQWDITMHWRR
ncbi:hypothetical protein L6164_002347 [Bauhinia variegata]|uniref:Uncharacterized protein n=1 Tax=Bauhinia variegata TaxID=167791 RepID=A0ACB9PXX8_BAUVA|nr:hypothetical protein L6164_002347 [Bauhinia variegata]